MWLIIDVGKQDIFKGQSLMGGERIASAGREEGFERGEFACCRH